MKLECPVCNTNFDIDISKAIDENGEVFQCPNCKYKIRYTIK